MAALAMAALTMAALTSTLATLMLSSALSMASRLAIIPAQAFQQINLTPWR